MHSARFLTGRTSRAAGWDSTRANAPEVANVHGFFASLLHGALWAISF